VSLGAGSRESLDAPRSALMTEDDLGSDHIRSRLLGPEANQVCAEQVSATSGMFPAETPGKDRISTRPSVFPGDIGAIQSVGQASTVAAAAAKLGSPSPEPFGHFSRGAANPYSASVRADRRYAHQG
jgi:hypothetical protein